jgi:hypothetical protein
MSNTLELLFIIGLGLALFFLVIPESKKFISIAYSVMVGLVFILNFQSNTLIYSLIKSLTAFVALTILNLSPNEKGDGFFNGLSTGRVFRVATLVLGFVFVLFISNSVSDFFSLEITHAITALLLIACGFVQIGTSVRTFRIILGLLVLLQGFEIIYGAIESSIFVNGLISLIDLLIALVGSYLLNQSQEEITG